MVRNTGRGTPCRVHYSSIDGTVDRWNNAEKRARRRQVRRYIAAHRNEPHSGWKRAVRERRL